MPQISQIAVSYDVVTPLMIGGANHRAEFRLASYVNMVRWWWRFLALGRYGDNEALASFWEAVLFGWADKPFGRKRVRFRLANMKPGSTWNGPAIPGGLNDWSGINYLTAQGFKDGSGREPVDLKEFTIDVGLRNTLSTADIDRLSGPLEHCASGSANEDWRDLGEGYKRAIDTLIDAVALIGLAGGLGARSRRGFGSLAVNTLDGHGDGIDAGKKISGRPASSEDYLRLLQRVLGSERFAGNGSGEVPPYTAFSEQSPFDICASGRSIAQLMNEIGWAFQIYRSWGQRIDNHDPTRGHEHVFKRPGDGPKIVAAGQDKSGATGWYEDAFFNDYKKFYAGGATGNKFGGGHTDNRSVFGLPHNYGTVQVGWSEPGDNGTYGRRASPLFIHFHRLENETHVCLCATLPAKLVPGFVDNAGNAKSAELHVSAGKRHRNFPTPTDWSLVCGFADFLRYPPPGVDGGENGGVIHTEYTPEHDTL